MIGCCCRFQFVSLLALGVTIAGCNKKSEDTASPGPETKSGSSSDPQAPAPSVRAHLISYRPLLDEVSRAELDAGGELIDFGTPAQHKYTRGAWRTGWGKSGIDDHTTWIGLKSKQGFLDMMPAAAPPTAIVVRARSSTSGQSLSFHIDGKEIGAGKLTKDWSVLRVPIDADAIPHDKRFRFEVRAGKKSSGGPRAELDWLWLASADGDPAVGPRIKPLAIGGATRRSLAAPTPRTYSFYLSPPKHAKLVVDIGATKKASFVVSATADGATKKELLHTDAAGSWKEQEISLADYAGKAIRLDLTTSDQNGEAGWGEPELMLDTPPETPKVAGGAHPKNVIFLLMDTARADAYGPFAGPDRVATTPNYDAFAKQSMVFTSAYDNENWTKPSVASYLSGLYPSTHNTKKDESKLPSEVELISEHLKRAGFATAGFVANGYVSDRFGFDQGWDVFKNYIREEKPSEAEYVFHDGLAWLDKHAKSAPDKPFFLYLQTIDPHVSYRDKGKFTHQYFEGDYKGPLGSSIDAEDQVKLSTKKLEATDTDLKWLRAMYYGEISYNDDELGKFIKGLEKRGLFADTMFVITNDHGEELGERGRFGHGHQVFEELIRAPLLVHYPPMFGTGNVVPDIVEAVDVAPTILDTLGRDPMKDADGVSFLPLVTGKPTSLPHYSITEFLSAQRVVRIGTWKMMSHVDGSAELFDLAKDPEEQHELTSAPIARRLCQIYLGEGLATPDKATRIQGLGGRRHFRAGAAVISPRMRRQLEALGYFGSSSADDDDDEDNEGTK